MTEELAATDWAYAAGFVDGEGCIAVVRSFTLSRGRYNNSRLIAQANACSGELMLS